MGSSQMLLWDISLNYFAQCARWYSVAMFVVCCVLSFCLLLNFGWGMLIHHLSTLVLQLNEISLLF